MSRYYRDLHERELLNQATLVLREVFERNLLDVFLLPGEEADDSQHTIFPRRLSSISVENGRLSLYVEPDFFQRSRAAAAGE